MLPALKALCRLTPFCLPKVARYRANSIGLSSFFNQKLTKIDHLAALIDHNMIHITMDSIIMVTLCEAAVSLGGFAKIF